MIVGHPCGESDELRVADRLHLLDDGPFETFRAGRGSQGTVVAPVCGHVDAVEELANVNGGWGRCALSDNGVVERFEESVVIVTTFLSVEEDANDTTGESVLRSCGVSSFIAALNEMHEVNLQVVELAAHGMLGGSVEVELSGSEIGHAAVGEGELKLGVFGESSVIEWGGVGGIIGLVT